MRLKAVAVLLAAVLAISLSPALAFAETDDNPGEAVPKTAYPGNPVGNFDGLQDAIAAFNSGSADMVIKISADFEITSNLEVSNAGHSLTISSNTSTAQTLKRGFCDTTGNPDDDAFWGLDEDTGEGTDEGLDEYIDEGTDVAEDGYTDEDEDGYLDEGENEGLDENIDEEENEGLDENTDEGTDEDEAEPGYDSYTKFFTHTGLFTVSDGTGLTFENIIVDGNKAEYPGNTSTLVMVEGGVFTMNVGAVLRDNISCFGGGVYVSSGGFVMKGGKICGNESVCIEVFGKDIDEMRRNFSYLESEYTEAALRMMLSSGMLDIIRGKGGGVFVDFGTFTMGGGEISGNEARYKSSSLMNDSTGGGVYTGEGGKFEMGGSARILHNKAGEGSGVCNSGAFNMGGSAEIVGNNSDSGSAVVNLGTFTMDGETKISENSGSGVDNRGTFNMGGSAVIKNNIKNGVSNENIFIMGGSAVVKDNRKRGVFSSKTFEMGGSASIEGNNDGGVHNNGDFNMGGEAVISDNINHDDGGGVFNRGTFTMGGSAEISKNHAAAGGGVYNDGSFSMDGYAIIKDNHASLPRRTHENDGGGGVFNKGAFTMGGLALISGNSAQNGSGIFWEGGGINLSGSAMVGTHTRDNEITRGAGQAINIAAEGLKGAYYNISPPPSSAGVKFDVKGTVIAKKAEGSVTNAEAGYFYYAGSSFRCIEKDGDVILLPRHERGWILILVLATGTALLLLVLTLSGRLRIGKRVLTVIIVGVVATGMVFSILFDQNQRGDDYHALAREQYKWDMHYLRADTESPPTAGSDGTVDYKSTATYLIAICFVNDFPEFGIDPGQFVRIVINGLPSNYGPDWMPIEDVMENRQRVAYFCFAGEKGAYLGWGAKKGIDSARAFAGSAGSKGPCLYKTFAANKAYFDQLMYRDFPESCVGGVIPLDTEIIDWPLPMAKILVDMYDAENADDAEDTDDADGAEDTEDANSAGDADDAEYAGDEETQAADIE